MSVADIERRKRAIALREWCFKQMLRAGYADEKTGICETIEDCDECVKCRYGAAVDEYLKGGVGNGTADK